MEKYSPIAVGETWIDGYDNTWFVLEYIPNHQNAYEYYAKCVSGWSIGVINQFSKHGERRQHPAYYEGKKNLIKKVLDNEQ